MEAFLHLHTARAASLVFWCLIHPAASSSPSQFLSIKPFTHELSPPCTHSNPLRVRRFVFRPKIGPSYSSLKLCLANDGLIDPPSSKGMSFVIPTAWIFSKEVKQKWRLSFLCMSNTFVQLTSAPCPHVCTMHLRLQHNPTAAACPNLCTISQHLHHVPTSGPCPNIYTMSQHLYSIT